MTQYGWPQAPARVRSQIDGIVAGLEVAMGEELVGLYLHGSLALGSFNPEVSDVDLLAVARRKLILEEKAELATLFAEWSGRPCKIELHVLAETELHPWRHPLPFDFHWGESWREAFEADLEEALSRQRLADPDLAAHVTVTIRHGVALVGPAPQDVLPDLPWPDYVDSLVADLAWALDTEWPNALYRVLSPARIWATLATRDVHSKDSGAAWALERLPTDLRPLLARGLARHRGESASFELQEDELEVYTAYLVAEIRSLASRYAP
jgi:streptomycin 3"-adenylyltransferase